MIRSWFKCFLVPDIYKQFELHINSENINHVETFHGFYEGHWKCSPCIYIYIYIVLCYCFILTFFTFFTFYSPLRLTITSLWGSQVWKYCVLYLKDKMRLIMTPCWEWSALYIMLNPLFYCITAEKCLNKEVNSELCCRSFWSNCFCTGGTFLP